MATQQRRLEIVIAWMQQHPGVVRNVQAQLNSLLKSYVYLRKNINQLNLTTEEQAEFSEQLLGVYQQMRVRAGANAQTVNMLNKTLKATTAQIGKTATAGGIFNKIFTRMGYRTSWIGFRMAIMGRIIMKSVLAPMQKMTGALTNWEKSMETVAMALAFQEAGMGETGMSAEELRQTLEGLIEQGPRTQTAMEGLGATWAALATKNAPALRDIIGEIQDALEGVGGAIITSMVDAVRDAIPWMGELLDLLEPISDQLGTFAGWLIIAAGAMTIVGTAIYLAKPALLALQYLLNPIVLALISGVVMILLWKRYWGDWAAYMENVVIPIMEATMHWMQPLIDMMEMLGIIKGGPVSTGAGWAGQSIERLRAQQEIDIDLDINIENILGEIDLDAMINKTTDELASLLRQRGYP